MTGWEIPKDEEGLMNKEEIYQTIREILPKMDECGINLSGVYDDENNRWCINSRINEKRSLWLTRVNETKVSVNNKKKQKSGKKRNVDEKKPQQKLRN